MKVLWAARRSNLSILKEISREYSLEGLILKLLILWPPDVKRQLLEKSLMLGKTEGRRRRGRQRLDGITDSMDMGLSELWATVKVREARPAAIHAVTKSQTQFSD